MIPASLFYARVHTAQETTNRAAEKQMNGECRKEVHEVRALELGPDFFTFRLKKGLESAQWADEAEIGFGTIRAKGYCKVYPEKFRIQKISSEKYYDVYRFETEDAKFAREAAKLTAEYTGYINLRYECDDAQLSHELTGYDVDEDDIPDSMDTFRTELFGQHPFGQHPFGQQIFGQHPFGQQMFEQQTFGRHSSGQHLFERDTDSLQTEFGMALSFPDMWNAYLTQSTQTFVHEWFIKYARADVDVDKCGITHLYLGSQMCMLRWPDDTIMQLLDKAEKDGVKVVAAFAPMQETFTELVAERLAKLNDWCVKNDRRLELVINDMGMLQMIREMKFTRFDLTMGVMILRHRKDTRSRWRALTDISEISDPAGPNAGRNHAGTWIDEPENMRLLAEKFGVSGVSFEQCGENSAQCAAKERNEQRISTTVYTPYYQMNTSAMCTLYASVKNGDRGKQVQVKRCPYYCQEKHFMYPRGMNMVGIGNTLFGLDTGEWNENMQIEGADRYVFNFM